MAQTDDAVLVQFGAGRAGVYQASISQEDLARRSAEALEKAMHAIEHMSERVVKTVRAMPHQMSEVEVEFGIVLTIEAGALISKAGADATINVKLTFQQEQEEKRS
jgi:hypothetical protein